ncbi:SUMF1/EgtB/PvdO family nonheme iron enzyme [Candidatus Sumerlaeota bacterium]|nr:SUMF1/EgtB/PvdO family nonheme iron enzyme [Candidatus Sumerlaeota bacterium]
MRLSANASRIPTLVACALSALVSSFSFGAKVSDLGDTTRTITTPATTQGLNYTEDLGDGVTLEMVWIPGGTFAMGSPADEANRDADEGPQSTTAVQGFWMARYETTNAQFRRFRPKRDSLDSEGMSLDGGDRPAVYVSWDDAAAFCQWLSERSDRKYALPTEAQWEYACRAGTTTSRFWGDSETSAGLYANTADRTLKGRWPDWTTSDVDDGYVVTAPVGRFRPNAFGLYDMIGNVAELCLSTYQPYPYVETGGRNEPGEQTIRAVRGGSWRSHGSICRSAYRDKNVQYRPLPDTGFRVVATGP